jgi:transmembrane sensor
MTAASSRQIELTAAEWLARRESGDWSTDDGARLDAWLAAATAHRVAFLRLEAAWVESGRLQALAAGRTASGPPPRGPWATTPDRIAAGTDDGIADRIGPLDALVFSPRRAEKPRRRWAGATLAATVLACGTLAAWGWKTYTAVETASYASAAGQLRELRLSDGTRATLSGDSRIDVAMSRGERRIVLARGEAFFQAAKDRQRPFVVDADARRVVAVGTRFSVRRDGPDLRVVVTEGLVRLESEPSQGQPPAPTALLPAGSSAHATRSGVMVRAGTVAEAERALDWRSGFLHFDDTPLAEAAAEFNRYSGRTVLMGDDATAALRIGGNVRWSNVDGFVRLLEQGFDVHAERRGEIIILHSGVANSLERPGNAPQRH